jgi:hypothetical protein
MHSQHENNHNKPQMEIAMQRMVEVHTDMMQVMTQYIVNCDSKELPPRMQQVQNDHFWMIQMMPQILASTNNNLPQNDLGSKEPRDGIEITLPGAAFYVKNKDTSRVLCLKLQEARTL